jgi:hypothetical protein
MKVEDSDTANAVVIIVVGKKSIAVIIFTNFCNHTTGYNVIADRFEGNLGYKFFHKTGVGLVGEDGWSFSFNSIDIPVFDGAYVHENLWQFRDLSFARGALEEVLLFEIQFHFAEVIVELFGKSRSMEKVCRCFPNKRNDRHFL